MDRFVVIGMVCGWGTYLIPAIGIIAVALDRFGRDREHLPPAIGYFRLAARLKRLSLMIPLYVGKRPTSKGIGELYGGLWRRAFTLSISGHPRAE